MVRELSFVQVFENMLSFQFHKSLNNVQWIMQKDKTNTFLRISIYRQYVFSNRQALLHQLNQETDPALVLHLTVLILFQTFTNCMLHASGKFVPQILNFLASHLTAEVHQVLHTYQGEKERKCQEESRCGDRLDP